MKINKGELMHYGMPRRSGRYKWGSGKNPYHHGQSIGATAAKKTLHFIAPGTKAIPKISSTLEKRRKENEPSKKVLTSEEKEKMIRGGAAKKVLVNKEQFDDRELQRAVNRLNLERQLDNFDFEKRHKSIRYVQRITDSIDKSGQSTEKIVRRGSRLLAYRH